MSAAIPNRKTVLFVDDDAQFLELLQPYMERLSRGEWEVLVASNSGAALSTLNSRTIDLAVLDVQLPVMDGVQLLQLVHRKHPQLKKAVLSGFVDEGCRSRSLIGGAELVLEKPHDASGYEALFAALNELLHAQSEQGFRGMLRKVGLEDIIQMECLSRHSLILEVVARGNRGRLYICEGALVHAEFGQQSGEAGLQKLLSLTGGEFHHRTYTAPPAETLEGSWEFLLMEAVRQRDEAVGAAAEKAAEEARASAVAPGPAPSVELPSAPVVPDEPPAEIQIEEQAPVINELVVCSAQGELLYASQSPNPQERCHLCVALLEAAERLQPLLPFGMLERVEFVSVSGRMLTRLQDGQAVFLRANDL